MARTGQSVCLLERGSEKWPGEYPTGATEAFKELHVSGSFAPFFLDGKQVDGGNPTGMYHLIFGKGQNAVVCNGMCSRPPFWASELSIENYVLTG
jgi:choline dehydrogenase-like flavoprotein